MRITIEHHHYFHYRDDESVKSKLDLIIQKLKTMADKFDVLTTEVSDLGTVVDSAVTLLDNIADQIADAKDDPEQIQVIVDGIRAKKTALAAAVAKNTSAAGETPAAGGDTQPA